jgi:hypothetical protein
LYPQIEKRAGAGIGNKKRKKNQSKYGGQEVCFVRNMQYLNNSKDYKSGWSKAKLLGFSFLCLDLNL